jgi:hypothetical protein
MLHDMGETKDVLTANTDVGVQLTSQLAAWMKAVKVSS